MSKSAFASQTPEIAVDLLKHAKERTKCELDRMYFATHYVHTLDQQESDPRRRVKLYPHYPYLEELINELGQGGALIIEKTRQMMVSWTLMAVHAVHGLLFDEGFTMYAVSRKGTEVDNGGSRSTPRSLFGKTRFTLERLPEWLIDRDKLDVSLYKIVYGPTSGSMEGESSENAGRGVTAHTVFCDEFAFLENQDHVHSALSGSEHTLYVIASTPGIRAGTDVFTEIAQNPEEHGFRKLRLHWTRHPQRWQGAYDAKGNPTSDWYRRKKKEFADDAKVAVELDIQYGGLKSHRIFPEFNPDVHVTDRRPSPEQVRRVVLGMDYQYLNPTSIVAVAFDETDRAWVVDQVYQPELHIKHPEGGEDVLDKLELLRTKWAWDVLKVGPEAPERYVQLETAGVQYEIIHERVVGGIAAMKRRMALRGDGLPGLLIHSSCKPLIDQLQAYRRKQHRAGGFAEEPLAGQMDHAVESLRYALSKTRAEEEMGDWLSTW